MSEHAIVWTVLPHGWVEHKGQRRPRLSVFVAPRLTPKSAQEQHLGAFPAWVDWPATLAGLKFGLSVNGAAALPLARLGAVDASLWPQVFPERTPVAGWTFTDMAQMRWHSYPTRTVAETLRFHYAQVARKHLDEHPTLLPGSETAPSLRGLLLDLGLFRDAGLRPGKDPGFERTMAPEFDQRVESAKRVAIQVVDAKGEGREVQLTALPARWSDAPATVRGLFRSEAEYALYQADRFYRRRTPRADEKALRRPDFKNIPPSPKDPELDFHGIVAALGDHPALMRALGLVLDFALVAKSPIDTAAAKAAGGSGQLHLVVDGLGGSLHRQPSTAWRVRGARFLADALDSDLRDGLLNLAGAGEPVRGQAQDKLPNPHSLLGFDADGAALKTVQYLLSSTKLLNKSVLTGSSPAGEVTYTTGERQPLAALRSGSISLGREGRALQLAQRAAQVAQKNTDLVASSVQGRDVVFRAEDLLRGYRVDVLDRGRWRPLLARIGDYRLRGGAPLQPFGQPLPPDEGYVKAASTSSPAEPATPGPDEHYLHETLCRWAGWSLAVPRPGRAIRNGEAQGSGLQTETPTELDETRDAAGRGSPVLVSFRVPPASLPRLRFGQTYRLRVRLADLAGNGLGLDEVGSDDQALEGASQPIPYGRMEPLDPPALVHRHRVSEGESLERMVIRSGDSQDGVPAYTAQAMGRVMGLRAQQGTPQDFDYRAVCERHVVPPKTSQWQAEQHGGFDRAFDDGRAAVLNQAYAVAAREAGSLFDRSADSQIEIVTPARLAGIATTTALPVRLPQPDAPAGDRLAAGQYLIHGEALIETPYLSDPAAGGLVLRDLESLGIALKPLNWPDGASLNRAAGESWVLKLPFLPGRGKGPVSQDLMRQSLRILLAERAMRYDPTSALEQPLDDGLPQWNPKTRELTLFLAKGRQARLRYACHVDPAYRDHFALPRWAESAAADLSERAAAGLHPMITPYRTLELVHGTQRPVFAPAFERLSVSRAPGASTAQLHSPIRWHGPSTGQLEILADWVEWVDKPELPQPVRQTGTARLARIELPREGLCEAGAITQASDARRQRPLGELVELLARTDTVRGDLQDFGDTRFRLVRYRMVASSRFREYLPPELWEDDGDALKLEGPAWEEAHYAIGAADDPGAPVLRVQAGPLPADGTRRAGVVVPASARPAAPVLGPVLPTVRWLPPTGGATQARTREGNGLRVYLERPWFSSGDGELLGVVLAGEGVALAQVGTAQAERLTQWGQDPLWRSRLPSPKVSASAFPLAVGSETVSLPDGGGTVLVVGHRVDWDAEQGRWYCDLEIQAGPAYMPFVRLALVRYQPHALPEAKVSSVVMAEFVQLLPRRRCTLSLPLATANPPIGECAVYGRVPEAGSAAAESPYSDLSLMPGFGSGLPGPVERSRNRIELVLQRRPAGSATDLDWDDVRVLGSATATPTDVPKLAPQPVRQSRPLGTLKTEKLGPRLDLPLPTQTAPTPSATLVPREGLADALLRPDLRPELLLLEDPCWTLRFSLAAGERSADHRLVLREFERFHSDRSIAVSVEGRSRSQRVIEERLVFSTSFATQ
ncbi:hypothetical protein [Aquariibacter albus]|uniref:Uncharacterized protein n=1 Tax=Aquariibacter albus TaxID=2759899 RepID=A0A839HRV0_9BURK|nr:hypothetical protein [Aquariibacter albus]MBB1162200.1 hypothetical protein [Aquariibacter albus]